MTDLSRRFIIAGRKFFFWSTLVICVGLLLLSLILAVRQDKQVAMGPDAENTSPSISGVKSESTDPQNPAELDNPSTDGWQSEAVADQIKHQLEDLLRLANSPMRNTIEKYDAFVSANYRGERLIPNTVESVYEDQFFTINRSKSLPASQPASDSELSTSPSDVDRAGFIQSLVDWGKSLGDAAELRYEIKVIRVEQKADRAKTKQKIAVTGQGKDGGYEQHAVWSCIWQREEMDGHWKLLDLEILDFEVVSSIDQQEALFLDGTVSVLEKDPCFESQILQSYNTHLKRMQDWRYSARIGWTGMAVADVNGDGREDIYVTQDSGLPNLLLIQQQDGTVLNAADQWGVDWLHDSPAALFLDFDNDRDQDLAVALEAAIVLCANNGDHFEVKKVLPIPDDVKSLSAADFDLDGKVDLFCCIYDRNSGMGEGGLVAGSAPLNQVFYDSKSGGPNILFRNQGAWNFEDVTDQVGLGEDNVRLSYASAWEDFDNDGDPDLYIANDFAKNQLFRNDLKSDAGSNLATPHFVDVAEQTGTQDQAGGMSVSWSDQNRDGLMDLYVGNMFSSAGNRVTTQEQFKASQNEGVRGIFTRFSRGNSLFVNRGDGSFEDAGEDAGVAMGRWAWSSCFADVNNDGWQDILIANGFITGETRQQDL
ncbi:MAG: VCBS repeat-containing protein [Planctomycetota bacterium]|nr:VCBS repeat-containing protein [Planctomycetota bacterium]